MSGRFPFSLSLAANSQLFPAIPSSSGWNFSRLGSTMRALTTSKQTQKRNAGFLLQREGLSRGWKLTNPWGVALSVVTASSLMRFATVVRSAAACPLEVSPAAKPHEPLISSRTATSPALPTRNPSCLESTFLRQVSAATHELMLIQRRVGWRYGSSSRFRGKK